MKILPNTIYLWQDKGHYYGVAQSKGNTFYAAWYIEEDPKYKGSDSLEKQTWRAKLYCETQLSNTLNALKLYGKKILDKDGNIDGKKFHEEELFGTYAAFTNKKDLNKERPLKRFKTIDITLKQAKELKLV